MNDLKLHTPTDPQAAAPDAITVGRTSVLNDRGDEAVVFTMTLGGETIELLPLRNWSQLDLYKWRARGKLPGTPAGLEIGFDHVRVTGTAVPVTDPDRPDKLQKLLNDWLALELKSFRLAQQKAHAEPASVEHETDAHPQDLLPHFRVEVDKEGQVHIHCRQGREELVTIGLNMPGFSHLFSEGLMHKPRSLKVGALHDWVELDGELFSFEKGNNDAARLEKALNERYLPAAALGQGRDVVVLTNAASSTGFDVKFAAKVGGITDRRRRPLNEESLELLQDPERCGLLPRDIVLKLSRPHLIFKRKTVDGGERYLEDGPGSIVTVLGDGGEVTVIDLTKPVNYLRLSAVELTAVFNHPTVNLHSRAAPPPRAEPPAPAAVVMPQQKADAGPVDAARPQPELSRPTEPRGPARPPQGARTLPNLWLQDVFSHASISHEWFSSLVYTKVAEHFGSSAEGFFGPFPCWVCSLGEVEDISDPGFRGVFLTQKGWLGYLNQGQLARFRNEVAFVGALESAIEGIGVSLVAVGVDSQQRIVFIVNEGYRTKFGLPDLTLAQELTRLRKCGVSILSIREALQGPDPLDVVWTVPAAQPDPADPQAAEHLRPSPCTSEPALPEPKP